jgi:hypothetical protein
MSEESKKIDETWKEAVDKDKKNQETEGKFIPEDPDFKFFVTTLAIQASIFLGVLPNPVTNKKDEKNLPQAKFIIDTLDMLKEKTKGNLNQEETTLLENVLYELKMQYVAEVEGKPDA